MNKQKTIPELIDILKNKDTLEHIAFYTYQSRSDCSQPPELHCEIGGLYNYKDWVITQLANDLNKAIEPVIKIWVEKLGIDIVHKDNKTEIKS